MTLKIFRRGSARCIGLLSAFATILLCLYYISIGQSSVRPGESTNNSNNHGPGQHLKRLPVHHAESHRADQGTCPRLEISNTDITTMAEYAHFDFQVWAAKKLREL